jgi:hypothetical protein
VARYACLSAAPLWPIPLPAACERLSMPRAPTLLVGAAAATCTAQHKLKPFRVCSRCVCSPDTLRSLLQTRTATTAAQPCLCMVPNRVLTRAPGLWLRTAPPQQRMADWSASAEMLLRCHPRGRAGPTAGPASRPSLRAPRRRGQPGSEALSPAAAAPAAARGSGGGPARRREGRSCGGAPGATATTVPASCCNAVAEVHQQGRCSYLINMSTCPGLFEAACCVYTALLLPVSGTAQKPDQHAAKQRSLLLYCAASTYGHETLLQVRSSRTSFHLFQGMHQHAVSRQRGGDRRRIQAAIDTSLGVPHSKSANAELAAIS